MGATVALALYLEKHTFNQQFWPPNRIFGGQKLGGNRSSCRDSWARVLQTWIFPVALSNWGYKQNSQLIYRWSMVICSISASLLVFRSCFREHCWKIWQHLTAKHPLFPHTHGAVVGRSTQKLHGKNITKYCNLPTLYIAASPFLVKLSCPSCLQTFHGSHLSLFVLCTTVTDFMDHMKKVLPPSL